jgi:hypothetical protein
MKKWCLLSVIVVALVTGCKDEEEAGTAAGSFFPVLPFIKSQVAHVDSSVYTITQVTKHNGVSDTAYIKREDFEKAARDFLTLPDITGKKLRKKYTESNLYDETLDKVILTYTPKDKDLEIVRQDVIIRPDQQTGDAVETIYIEQVLNDGDSTVQKKMTWEVDKSFQVRSIIQKKNAPEKVKTVDVSWSIFR